MSTAAAAAAAAAAKTTLPKSLAAVRYLWAVAVAALLGGGGAAVTSSSSPDRGSVQDGSKATATAAAAASSAPSAAAATPEEDDDAALAALEAMFAAAADAARLAYLIPTRLARDVAAAAAIVADYRSELGRADAALEQARLSGDLLAVSAAERARAAALKGCHQRGADRLLQLCFDNGGVYVKLGQHVGQLDHLLPQPYVSTMRRHLLDRCPASAYEDVVRVVERDLGSPPEALFATFNKKPVASASLAQVHEATSHPDPETGLMRRLAVKVQHPGLRESCAADIAMISVLARAARAVFPEFDMQWLVDEVEHNLPLELDFRHEARNAARCAANLASPRSRLAKGKVVVPEVLPELSSARVLTMEWIEGASLADAEALDALKADRREVSLLVARTFNEMVFTFGDLHADPHAANLLVRRVERGGGGGGGGGGSGGGGDKEKAGRAETSSTSSGSKRRRSCGAAEAAAAAAEGEAAERAAKAAAAELAAEDARDPAASRRRQLGALAAQEGDLQLVLLDHGLYRRIDDAFRLRYAALWRALIFADEAAIREHATAMGAGHAVPLFAGMLTQRPWHAVVGSASQFEADAQGNPVAAAKQQQDEGGGGGGAAATDSAAAPNELDGSYDPVAASNPAAAAALKAAAAARAKGSGRSSSGPGGPAGGLDRLSLPRSEQEREVLQAYAAHYGKEIGALLGKLPRELLLLLKTNDCLRSVDALLGSPVNTYAVTARECCRALAERRAEEAPGVRARAAAAADLLGVEARMRAMAALTWWYRPRGGGGGGGGGKKEEGGGGDGGDGGGDDGGGALPSGAMPPPPPPPPSPP